LVPQSIIGRVDLNQIFKLEQDSGQAEIHGQSDEDSGQAEFHANPGALRLISALLPKERLQDRLITTTA
jgi:hypothetical protein